MEQVSRRAFMAGVAAAGLGGCVSGTAFGGSRAGAAAAEARTVYEAVMERMFVLEPENATWLGVDTGERDGLKSRLTDLAVAGRNGWWPPLVEALPRLRAIDRAALPPRERALRDTAIWFGERAAERRSFAYGMETTPYVMTQIYGASVSVPNFLDVQHKIESAADAEAYLARLEAFPRLILSQVEFARADAGAGIMPPDFILDKAIRQTRTVRAQRGAGSDLVRSLVRRTREKALAGDWEMRAVRIVDGPLADALARQEELLADLRQRSTSEAGIGRRLPRGDEF